MRYKLNMKEECMECNQQYRISDYEEHMTNDYEEHMTNDYEEHMTNDSKEHMTNDSKEHMTNNSKEKNQVKSQFENSEKTDEFKYQMIGNVIQYGSVIISEVIKAISHNSSQKKNLEIEQLKLEKANMENKKIENDNRKKMLELELNNIENDYLNNSIINYKYEKNLSNIEKMEEIHNNLKNELKNIINELILNDNFIENIKKKILNLITEKKKLLKISKRMNIYIMGITGVGKSCLKNSICNKDLAEEKTGGRGTKERFTYICDCHNFMSITDNLGIELSKNLGIEKIKKDSQKFIMEKIKLNEEAIHCIWYCITGTRIQDSEMDLICELRKLYKNNNIPIIIIYTQNINKNNYNDMKKYINDNIRKNNNEELGEEPKNIQFIPIIAKKMYINCGYQQYEIKPYNVSKLIEKTFNCFEYSVNIANKKSLIELISLQIINDYETIYNNSLRKIESKNIYDEKQLIEFTITLIYDFLSFNFKNEQFFNFNTIKELIISYINENYEIFKSEKVLSLINEIIKIEIDFCLKNSNDDINLFSLIKTEEKLKEIIERKINEKHLEQYKKHYFNEICKELFKILISEIKENILNIILTMIENDKTIQINIDSSIKLNQTNITNGVNNLINELKNKEK